MTIEEARDAGLRTSKLFAGSIDFDGVIREINIPSENVKDGIPVTVYKPSSCGTSPSILVYLHGGGNCLGSRASHDTICRLLGRDAGCVVANVEYRLAPEFKFPSNHEDVLCAVQWVKTHKEDLGGSDNSTVGVCGDSAGGRLAAVVCHEERGIDYQILVYPNVDSSHASPSHQEFVRGPGLTKDVISWFMDLYFENFEDRLSLRGSPIKNDMKSFTNLPPALHIVAELDPLRDNAILYHEKMKSAGVKSEMVLVPGVVHAYFTYPGHFKESSKAPNEKIVQFIKEHS